MYEDIAVLVNEEMRTSDFSKSGTIIIYRKSDCCWSIKKSIKYNTDKISSIKEMREVQMDLVTKLEQCRIIVGREVVGVAYNVLAASGFSIWELEGESAEFLDYILESEEKGQKSKETLKEIESKSFPKEIKDGYYFINLKEIQQKNIELSSKQILLPFLSSTVFYKLQVICSHIPPWLKRDLEKLSLEAKEVKVKEGEYNIIIYKKVCEN